MTTANDMVISALEEIQRKSPDEPLDSEDAAIVLKSLNKMLHGWELEYGIDLGHSDVVLTDTITLPGSHIRTVEANLSITIAPAFEAPTRAETALFAARGLRAMQGIYGTIPELGFDGALRSRTNSASGTGRFDG